MEKRIGLELRGRKPEELKELNLDNCKSPTIDGLTDKFCNLEQLSLNSSGLSTLKGFPSLPKLRKLELSDNRITTGLNLLASCKALKSLNLSGNRIKDLASLEPLAELANLRHLDLFHCEVTTIDDYRNEVFKKLPSLVGLDGFDKNDDEVEDSDDDLNGVEDDEDGEVVADGEEDEIGEGEDDDDDDDDDEDDDEDEVGLSAIYKDNLGAEGEEEEDDEDFDGEAAGDEDDDDAIEEEEEAESDPAAGDAARGTKRKHEEEEQA